MKKTKSEIAITATNNAMTNLLLQAAPFDIGIPAWAVSEMLNRKTHPLEPADVLGRSYPFRETNMLSDYIDTVGYEFTWGTLTEDVYRDDDDTLICRFEFCLKHVLIGFPQPAMVEDLFDWLYRHHPLYNENFPTDEADKNWFLLSFEGRKSKNISDLRCWLAHTFIPQILPELIVEGQLIIASAKAEEWKRTGSNCIEDLLIEKCRYQLCTDPSELNFNRLK